MDTKKLNDTQAELGAALDAGEIGLSQYHILCEEAWEAYVHSPRTEELGSNTLSNLGCIN